MVVTHGGRRRFGQYPHDARSRRSALCQTDRMSTHLGVCNLCEAICGLEVDDRGGPGHLDPRQRRRPLPRLHLPQGRVPGRRARRPGPPAPSGPPGGGDWVEIEWDEAFDLVADGLAEALNEHGRDIGVWAT